ncbi:dihydrouridine synthase protein [Cystoisospora suis]|uniref:Dihydrouridine synthase protein n=1 Tax=Cystoisospora suis TaxID=483139 RepID=A0A2C6L004_9APIC|nr:dihydrouridine synthase protein [Cystoisospora suis]
MHDNTIDPTGSRAVQDESEKDEHFYRGKWILAPMVRIGILPFRLECLKYGADLVYTEEIIDHKLLNTVRTFNEDFGTTEYIHQQDYTCVFSTCQEERGKVVLQLGTCDSVRALKASELVAQDVVGIDVNMGCPKSFSIKGGMGAALLKTPLIATDILKTLRRNLSCYVTCKIRLLDTIPQTIDFARMCESCGIDALALHARETHERPNHRAHWDAFPIVRSSLSIPFIANGDFLSSNDAAVFQEKGGGADSLMFARGALWDPSIFLSKPDGTIWNGPSSSVFVNRLTEERAGSSREQPTHVEGWRSSSNGAGDGVAAGSSFEAPRSLSSPRSAPPRLTLFGDYIKQYSSSEGQEGSRLVKDTEAKDRCVDKMILFAQLKDEIVVRLDEALSIICNAPYQAMKFALQSMAVHRDDSRELKTSITSSKSVRDLCKTLGIDSFYSSVSPALPPHANTLVYYQKQKKSPLSLETTTTTPVTDQSASPFTGPSTSLTLKRFLQSKGINSTDGLDEVDEVGREYVVESSSGGQERGGQSRDDSETAQTKTCVERRIDSCSHSTGSLSTDVCDGDERQNGHRLSPSSFQKEGTEKVRGKDEDDRGGGKSARRRDASQERSDERDLEGVKKVKVAEKEFCQSSDREQPGCQ